MHRYIRIISDEVGDTWVGDMYPVDGNGSYRDRAGDLRSGSGQVSEGLAEWVEDVPETNSGGPSSYYTVKVSNPVQDTHDWYMAECYDLIKALKLTWEEANIFKEIWRSGNARNMNGNEGNTDLRAAEKMFFFAEQNLKFIQMENNNA